MVDPIAALEGYAFTCIQCGCCCYQAGGVSITEKERRAIGQHSCIVPLKGSSSLYRCRILPLNNFKCPFLESNLCMIYEKRPEICRRFPLTMRYVPNIGYLYGTIICCGARIEKRSFPSPCEGYVKTLGPRFLSHFERMENRDYDAALALSKSVNGRPRVADVETVIKIWDSIGDLAFSDMVRRETLQWMSWMIMKAWYRFYLDVLQKEKILRRESVSEVISSLKELFPEYARSHLDELEKAKEKTTYKSAQPGEDSSYTFYTCKKNLETLRVPLSDEERNHVEFTEGALELSRNYYRFLARRNVRAIPFHSLVVPVAFVPEILHRMMMDVTLLAALLAKHRAHSSVSDRDLLDVIKLADDPFKSDFYIKQVLESYGPSALKDTPHVIRKKGL